MAYPPIFWDHVRDVFTFQAVSEAQMAFDLGLDRKHLREIARKMEWEKSCEKPRIPELTRWKNFYEAHTMERNRSDELKEQIKIAKITHNHLVELALLFKYSEFDSMEDVNVYLKNGKLTFLILS